MVARGNGFAVIASMRPAQLTPENSAAIGWWRITTVRFNEAGAINAGKRPPPSQSYPLTRGLQ